MKQSATGGAAPLIWVLGTIVLVLGLGASETLRRIEAHKARAASAALQAEIAVAKSDAAAALAAVIPPDAVELVRQSVYQVNVRDSNGRIVAFGTAFVVDRERGLLATNAHIVRTLPIDSSFTATIVNESVGEPIPIIGAKEHAGYERFAKLVDEYEPIRRSDSLTSPEFVHAFDLAFDTGLIIVDPIDADTGVNRLEPALPLASDEDLLALKAGDPVAIIGYPFDRAQRDTGDDIGSSRAERGVIAAMVSPLDTPEAKGDPVIANLIVHRMSSRPGNSGSPIIDGKGRVIGVESAGVPDGDSVAQRADMVRDLLEPLREEERLAKIFEPAWRDRLAYFARAADIVPFTAFAIRRDAPRATANVKIATIEPGAGQPFRWFSPEQRVYGSPVRYFLAAAPDIDDEEEEDADGDEEANDSSNRLKRGLGVTPTPVFRISRFGRYSELQVDVKAGERAIAFAYDYHPNYGGCEVEIYWRQHGEKRLKVNGSDAYGFNFLELPASEGPTTRHYLIVRRVIAAYREGYIYHCAPDDDYFRFGVVRWQDGESDTAEKSENTTIAATSLADRERFGGALADFSTVAKSGFAQLGGFSALLRKCSGDFGSCRASRPVVWDGGRATAADLAGLADQALALDRDASAGAALGQSSGSALD